MVAKLSHVTIKVAMWEILCLSALLAMSRALVVAQATPGDWECYSGRPLAPSTGAAGGRQPWLRTDTLGSYENPTGTEPQPDCGPLILQRGELAEMFKTMSLFPAYMDPMWGPEEQLKTYGAFASPWQQHRQARLHKLGSDALTLKGWVEGNYDNPQTPCGNGSSQYPDEDMDVLESPDLGDLGERIQMTKVYSHRVGDIKLPQTYKTLAFNGNKTKALLEVMAQQMQTRRQIKIDIRNIVAEVKSWRRTFKTRKMKAHRLLLLSMRSHNVSRVITKARKRIRDTTYSIRASEPRAKHALALAERMVDIIQDKFSRRKDLSGRVTKLRRRLSEDAGVKVKLLEVKRTLLPAMSFASKETAATLREAAALTSSIKNKTDTIWDLVYDVAGQKPTMQRGLQECIRVSQDHTRAVGAFDNSMTHLRAVHPLCNGSTTPLYYEKSRVDVVFAQVMDRATKAIQALQPQIEASFPFTTVYSFMEQKDCYPPVVETVRGIEKSLQLINKALKRTFRAVCPAQLEAVRQQQRNRQLERDAKSTGEKPSGKRSGQRKRRKKKTSGHGATRGRRSVDDGQRGTSGRHLLWLWADKDEDKDEKTDEAKDKEDEEDPSLSPSPSPSPLSQSEPSTTARPTTVEDVKSVTATRKKQSPTREITLSPLDLVTTSKSSTPLSISATTPTTSFPETDSSIAQITTTDAPPGEQLQPSATSKSDLEKEEVVDGDNDGGDTTGHPTDEYFVDENTYDVSGNTTDESEQVKKEKGKKGENQKPKKKKDEKAKKKKDEKAKSEDRKKDKGGHRPLPTSSLAEGGDFWAVDEGSGEIPEEHVTPRPPGTGTRCQSRDDVICRLDPCTGALREDNDRLRLSTMTATRWVKDVNSTYTSIRTRQQTMFRNVSLARAIFVQVMAWPTFAARDAIMDDTSALLSEHSTLQVSLHQIQTRAAKVVEMSKVNLNGLLAKRTRMIGFVTANVKRLGTTLDELRAVNESLDNTAIKINNSVSDIQRRLGELRDTVKLARYAMTSFKRTVHLNKSATYTVKDLGVLAGSREGAYALRVSFRTYRPNGPLVTIAKHRHLFDEYKVFYHHRQSLTIGLVEGRATIYGHGGHIHSILPNIVSDGRWRHLVANLTTQHLVFYEVSHEVMQSEPDPKQRVSIPVDRLNVKNIFNKTTLMQLGQIPWEIWPFETRPTFSACVSDVQLNGYHIPLWLAYTATGSRAPSCGGEKQQDQSPPPDPGKPHIYFHYSQYRDRAPPATGGTPETAAPPSAVAPTRRPPENVYEIPRTVLKSYLSLSAAFQGGRSNEALFILFKKRVFFQVRLKSGHLRLEGVWGGKNITKSCAFRQENGTVHKVVLSASGDRMRLYVDCQSCFGMPATPSIMERLILVMEPNRKQLRRRTPGGATIARPFTGSMGRVLVNNRVIRDSLEIRAECKRPANSP